ncbi:hypothetical protein L218DRAFT_1010676 [Marasmius fiardii PR-910]|nr:hypothetical protein L218DRAFT_1010676 [Marasmius fiardii PR-910]
MYQTVISAMLESGLLYPITLVLNGFAIISNSLSGDENTHIMARAFYAMLPPVMVSTDSK